MKKLCGKPLYKIYTANLHCFALLAKHSTMHSGSDDCPKYTPIDQEKLAFGPKQFKLWESVGQCFRDKINSPTGTVQPHFITLNPSYTMLRNHLAYFTNLAVFTFFSIMHERVQLHFIHCRVLTYLLESKQDCFMLSLFQNIH